MILIISRVKFALQVLLLQKSSSDSNFYFLIRRRTETRGAGAGARYLTLCATEFDFLGKRILCAKADLVVCWTML